MSTVKFLQARREADDIVKAFHEMLPDMLKTLEDVGKQRIAEARGGDLRREAAGITDQNGWKRSNLSRD